MYFSITSCCILGSRILRHTSKSDHWYDSDLVCMVRRWVWKWGGVVGRRVGEFAPCVLIFFKMCIRMQAVVVNHARHCRGSLRRMHARVHCRVFVPADPDHRDGPSCNRATATHNCPLATDAACPRARMCWCPRDYVTTIFGHAGKCVE
jgi:hypothetical protein